MKKLLILLLLFFSIGIATGQQRFININEDKQAHLLVGGLVSAVSYGTIHQMTGNKKKALYGSMALSLLDGIVKESLDYSLDKNYGTFDANDVIYTFAGGTFVSITLDITTHRRGRRIFDEAPLPKGTPHDWRERTILKTNERIKEMQDGNN